jgi:hypothetical protein
MIQGRPVLDEVFVNGHGPYRFLLDTGAELNHLDPSVARSIGLRPTFRTELGTATGSKVVTGAENLELTIGSERAAGQTFLFAGFETVHLVYPDVQGVLGQSFLSRFDYLLDLRRRQMEFGRHEPGPRSVRAPFRIVKGRPVIVTSLGDLVLDSGVSELTLFNLVTAPVSREVITMTGSLKAGLVVRKLSLDGRTLWWGEAVAVAEPAADGATGLLPVGLFRAVYVCNSEGYVELE